MLDWPVVELLVEVLETVVVPPLQPVHEVDITGPVVEELVEDVVVSVLDGAGVLEPVVVVVELLPPPPGATRNT